MPERCQTHPDITPYAELCVTSNFTFLTGASHPEELVTRAAELGLDAIAITDRNSLAGVVRAHVALRELARSRAEGCGVHVRSTRQSDASSRQIRAGPALSVHARALPRLIVGARLVLADSALDWLALPTSRAGYARLSRLISLGKRRADKGECHLTQADLLTLAGGQMILIALPSDTRAPGKQGGGRGPPPPPPRPGGGAPGPPPPPPP
ncbi:MAG: PHP domain-containing protein [Rhodobacteraceae bacterium]|nr:PHP domain-containing protein [Paracoccaceae bacterium]